MLKNRNLLFVLPGICLFLFAQLLAKEDQEFNREFAVKPSCEIKTLSGDCTIKTGSSDKILVRVVYSVYPEDAFKPEIIERTNSLIIKEIWRGNFSTGNVSWTITLPADTEVEFSSASGNLSIEGLLNSLDANTESGDILIESSQGEFDINTASGNIKTTNIKGEIDLNTASGDIDLHNSKGEFDLNCASGDIEARDVFIESLSSFSTASGDVDVLLAGSPTDDCKLSAASGDVTLDFNGNTVNGYIELSTRKYKGKIKSNIEFDREDEYERDGRSYLRKSRGKVGAAPEILLSTSSGKVLLKK